MSGVVNASIVMVVIVSVSSTIALWVVGMRFLRHRRHEHHEPTATRPQTLFTSSAV